MNRIPLIAMIACGLVLAACSGAASGPSPRSGGTITVALPAMPPTLNPLVSHDVVSERAYAPLFPLLYVAEPDLSTGPELATGSPVFSNGGRVITVALRSDAKWSDGTPITATDVVYTVTMEMNPALQGADQPSWAPLTEVRAVDAHTVQFTLSNPDAGFVADHLVTAVVPQHALTGVSAAAMASAPFSSAPTVSGGPFVFTRRDATTLTYDANPSFLFGRPHADHVVMRVVADAGTIPALLGEGSVSFAPELTPSAAAQAVSSSGVTVESYADTSFVAVVFNVRPGRVFSTVAVRHAFADGVSHDAVVAAATGVANDIPVWNDVNPESWAYSAGSVATYPTNTGEARRLLRGSHPSAALLYPSGDAPLATAAGLLASQADAAGFALRASAAAPAAYRQALAGGAFDAALVSVPTGLDPDDALLFAPASALDVGGYDNPTLLALLRRDLGATAPSLDQLQQLRRPILAQIEATVSAGLPMYVLWSPRHDAGFSATLGGVTGAGVQLDAGRDNTFYVNWFLTA